MYGFPSDIDLSFFQEKTLSQVCIGITDLILNFDDHVAITITSRIGWSDSNDKHDTYENFGNSAVVVNLLGKKVISARGDANGTLSLLFGNGISFYIYDDSEQYESYVIKNGDKLIVV